MGALTPSLVTGQGLFEGTSSFRARDDAADNKAAGAYSHVALEWSATEANEWVGYFLYLNSILGGGLTSTAIRNATGGALAKGTLVYVSGYDSGTSKLLISKADAAAPTSLATMVLAAALADATNGTAYGFTLVSGLDTSSASAVGSKVYLASGTPGTFVFDTGPSGSNDVLQEVGVVTIKDVTLGAIQFYPGTFVLQKVGASFFQAGAITLDASALLNARSFGNE